MRAREREEVRFPLLVFFFLLLVKRETACIFFRPLRRKTPHNGEKKTKTKGKIKPQLRTSDVRVSVRSGFVSFVCFLFFVGRSGSASLLVLF